MGSYVCAVDVGTSSARAGIFDVSGHLLARADHPIAMNRPQADYAEHDSENIWAAVSSAVRAAVDQARIAPDAVSGIALDATCSLVFRGKDSEQLSISPGGERRWDTIAWLDHRALGEADECTATGHDLLRFAGGAMSPEKQTPKLMWVKRNLPGTWAEARYIFDLADYLSARASGSNMRSQGTLTCKWAYLAHEERSWQDDFLADVGLADLLERAGLPEKGVPIGTELGPLTPQAARDLGLTTDCRVGAGLVDAYAGALGVLGGYAKDLDTIDRHLALIAGTSSCVMAISRNYRPFPGGWGPYYGAALPGCWIGEGGQSATGALLDHVIRQHAAGGEPSPTMHRHIAERVRALREAEGADLAPRLHVLPDFHGNRSPLANPHATGAISGLTLDTSFDGLCRLYWRTAIAIVLGVRHILETLNAEGHGIDTLHVTGGHTRNPLLMELYADATGIAVVEPTTDEAVLLGTAMVAAKAAGLHRNLAAAGIEMQQGGSERLPSPDASHRFDRDYRIFLKMHEQRRELEAMLGS